MTETPPLGGVTYLNESEMGAAPMVSKQQNDCSSFDLAVDMLLLTIAGETVRPEEGWSLAVGSVYGPEFDRIGRLVGVAVADAIARRGVRPGSATHAACRDAARSTIELATLEHGKLTMGAVFLAGRLLEQLTEATGRDPATVLRGLVERERGGH